MGSSQSNNGTAKDLDLVSVATDSLRDKLNRVYDAMRSRPRTLSNSGLFEYLWEMKELALMEGRQSIQLPTTWLEDLDDDFQELIPEASRGH